MKRNQNGHLIFEPVCDSPGRKIRGLWKRGDRYYAQVRVARPAAGGNKRPVRIPLGAISLPEAVAELERLRADNQSGEIVAPLRDLRRRVARNALLDEAGRAVILAAIDRCIIKHLKPRGKRT
jgi:hypothetical protein